MATKARKPKITEGKLANHQIVVLAAYLAGAHTEPADTEDIAVKANDVAPGRFTWRKYKNQINIDTVRKRLWDATKVEKGAYLIGSEKNGWRLTKAGFDFARKQAASKKPQESKKRASKTEQAAQTRELRRMVSEAAYQKAADNRLGTVTRSEAERFFRIDDYVTGKARIAKIERFRIMASGHEDVLKIIESLATLVREGR